MAWPPAPLKTTAEPTSAAIKRARRLTRWLALDCLVGLAIGPVIFVAQFLVTLSGVFRGSSESLSATTFIGTAFILCAYLWHKYGWFGVCALCSYLASWGVAFTPSPF